MIQESRATRRPWAIPPRHNGRRQKDNSMLERLRRVFASDVAAAVNFGGRARHTLSTIMVLLLAVVACTGPAPTAEPEPTSTIVPTATAAPTVVAVKVTQPPAPTASTVQPPRPTHTVVPTPAPTPTPVLTLVQQPTSTPVPTAVPMLRLPNVADTVEQVRPAVVSILSEVITRDRFGTPRSNFGSGTGVIFAPEGLVLTNNHVIEGASNITVSMDDGSQVAAKLIGADRLSDLAVLRIPGEGYTFLPLNRDVPVRVGEWVIAIGNALALPGGPTVTVGVISALGRTLGGARGAPLYDLIQTDTVINPGNSGGPLINLGGELVGINTAVLRGGGGGGPSIEGIGFAINMETAVLVADQLVEAGRVQWAWMAVFLADLIPERAAEFGLPIREGVVIQDVLQGGPSDQAGIRPGDIILSMNGGKVATVTDLTRLLRTELRVGQEIEVELFRNGSRRTVRLVLGERPSR